MPSSEKPEIAIRSDGTGSEMHEVLVGNITVGKCHRVNIVFGDQGFHVFFFQDRNALWIQAPSELGGIAAASDVRNLSCRESDYVVVRIIAK